MPSEDREPDFPEFAPASRNSHRLPGIRTGFPEFAPGFIPPQIAGEGYRTYRYTGRCRMTTGVMTNRDVARIFDRVADRYDECSNAYTVRRRADALAALSAGQVVEFGGGTGVVTARLSAQHFAVHTDIAASMCAVAKRKLGRPSICCDAEHMPIASAAFDTVIASEMIYYLQQPERFLLDAHRVLKPGGALLLCTPSPITSLLDRARTFLRRMGFPHMFFDDGSPSFLPWRELRGMLTRAGFEIERCVRIVPLPFARMEAVNRLLERTPFRWFGMFTIVAARRS